MKSERIEEIVAYSTYEVTEERPSHLGLKQPRVVRLGFLCPRCSMMCSALEHGQKTVCPSCELEFQLWGNGLHCRGTVTK